jgi:putative tricarboxylic transport membrane protein
MIMESLLQGFSVALQPLNLLLVAGGATLGTLVGMIPGLGPVNAIAVLLPLVFGGGLAPASAIILLAGIYYGSQYGNSIASILVNIPGTPSAVVTALDGHPMARQGRGGEALAVSAVASFVGGTLSIFGLILLAPILSAAAIRFGPAEYFALMVLAFTSVAGLSGARPALGALSTGLGLLLATVGLDPNSAVPRYTLGQLRLLDGMDFVVVTIGLFAIGELLLLAESSSAEGRDPAMRGGISTRGAARKTWAYRWTMARSSAVGFLVGVLPGAGGTIASFLAYGTEQKLGGSEGRFGQGDPRGVAAPEAANNAAANGAMIPLLTLGVPGSATTAVLLGALLALNVSPGPLLMTRTPEVFWGLVASMYVGNAVLLMLNLPLVGVFARVLLLPRWLLATLIAGMSLAAVYALNGSAFDVGLALFFGILGYGLRKIGAPLAPLILGVVLGPLMERSLRRSLALSGGDWSVLWSSPVSVVLWVLTAASVVYWVRPKVLFRSE